MTTPEHDNRTAGRRDCSTGGLRQRSGMSPEGCLGTAKPGRRPIGRFGPPDDAGAGNDAPASRVTRHCSVIAENEVAIARVALPAPGLVTAVGRPKIRLAQPGAVDEDVSGPHRDGLSGQADDPLDERPAGVTGSFDPKRRVEDDDVASFGLLEAIDEAVGDNSVGDSRHATTDRLGAVESRLHRRRRDPIWLRDFGLEDQHADDSQ